MGTWGPGPFANDAAAEFLDMLRASSARVVTKVLREIAGVPAGKYIDVDDGGAGWAACEMVALAFGYGDDSELLDDHVLDLAGKLRPNEEHRLLALEVLQRIADRDHSELSGLWHEGGDGATFDTALEHLRVRLQAASQGARQLSKPRPGDVIALPDAPSTARLIVVQVVGSGEVAVFEGTCADDKAAIDCVRGRSARRVPVSVNKLVRRGRVLGNIRLRKDLRGKRLYAGEAGAIEQYILMTASAGGIRQVPYEEAREYDEHRHYDKDAICAIAVGTQQVARVRSPDEREAALRLRNAEKWATRRHITTPGPFGDVVFLRGLLQWIEQYGIDNAVKRQHDVAIGMQGYGRPNENSERYSYAFAGLVAIWRGTWPRDMWPAELAGRLPSRPNDELMTQALNAARLLAGRVLTRDAELRLIWDDAPDNGAALRKLIASLQQALAE
jgi:Domain of unknown function (DUF4259)